jgi:hypothetical protein
MPCGRGWKKEKNHGIKDGIGGCARWMLGNYLSKLYNDPQWDPIVTLIADWDGGTRRAQNEITKLNATAGNLSKTSTISKSTHLLAIHENVPYRQFRSIAS